MLKSKFILIYLLIPIFVVLSRYFHSSPSASETNKSIENGKNLTFNICGQCHFNKETGKFIGKEITDLPAYVGKIYSANLTNSIKTGVITRYSDESLTYLLKTGVANDGRYVPYMIRPNLSEDDIKDIIAYLRSGEYPVQGMDTIVGKTDLTMIGNIGNKLFGKPIPYKKGVKRPASSDTIAVGKYLVDNLACYHCHSGSIPSLDYPDPEKSKNYMGGGMKFKINEKTTYASNLTPDETGISAYSKVQFRAAVKRGINKKGKKLNPPMQQFTHLSDEQADAIFAYLKQIPPIKNKVKKD